jgi:hypothetical protein
MPRDNEAIINLLHQAEVADRELLKQLIDAGAPPQILGMMIERVRISAEGINHLGEELRERTPFPSGLIGAAVACRPRLSNIPVPGEYRFHDVETERREIERVSQQFQEEAKSFVAHGAATTQGERQAE